MCVLKKISSTTRACIRWNIRVEYIYWEKGEAKVLSMAVRVLGWGVWIEFKRGGGDEKE